MDNKPVQPTNMKQKGRYWLYIVMQDQKQSPEVLYKKRCSYSFIKKETKNTFFTERFWTTASVMGINKETSVSKLAEGLYAKSMYFFYGFRDWL